MNKVIVLAMHGSPPTDFPREELTEFFKLHSQLEHMPKEARAGLEQRFFELDAKIRKWPRNQSNDPFYTGALDMAQNLEKASGHEVIVGFNEFCTPNLEEAIDEAVGKKPDKVIVVTPMMTRGGEHSEKDIPDTIEISKNKHPDIEIIYAWPFDIDEVAAFLADQIKRFV
jgi:sirohydrochlorin cobaltochelatase